MKSLISILCIYLSFSSLLAEDLYLPHYTFVDDGWQTDLTLSNPSAHASTLTITAYDVNGNQLIQEIWTVPALGTIQGDVRQLLPELQAESGWFHIQTDNEDLNGLCQFTAIAAKGTSSLPLSSARGQRLVLPSVRNSSDWIGGLAVVNTSDSATQISLDAYAADGRRLATTSHNLGAKAKWVTTLGHALDANELDAINTLVISADQDITGYALNFASSLNQIVAIPVTVANGRSERLVSDLSELYGQWRRRGYDDYLSIDENQLSLLTTTNNNCIFDDLVIPTASLQEFLTFSILGDGRLKIASDDNQTFYFEPMDSAIATDECLSHDMDPTRNFEALWTIFENHYVFFEERGIDPEALKASYQSQIDVNTSQADLFELFSEMLYNFNDPHVSLKSEAFGEFDSAHMRRYRQDVLARFQSQSEFDSFDAFMADDINNSLQSMLSYINDNPIRAAANGLVAWGQFDDNPHIGYLGIFGMMGFVEGSDDIEEELTALNDALDEAFLSLGNSEQIVVDIRLNTGGYDLASQIIADRFAKEKRRAYSKAALDNGYLTPFETHWIVPHEEAGRFNGTDIVLLTSELSASAAETFSLRMKSISGVTHMGEPTAGGFSDILRKVLPNGWTIDLSNEVYLDRNGQLHEGPGLIPDKEVLFWQESDREAGRDAGMEAALAHLNQLRKAR